MLTVNDVTALTVFQLLASHASYLCYFTCPLDLLKSKSNSFL